MAQKEPQRIRSVSRAITVVEHLAKHGRSSLVQLHQATGLSNAALMRVLSTLIHHGWVRRRLSEGQYDLTYSMASMLIAKPHSHPFAELAAPILVALQSSIRWPSDVAICVGPGKVRILESTRSQGALSPNRTIYDLHPSMVFSALGRAYLAFCDDEERSVHVQAIQEKGTRAEQRFVATGQLEPALAKTRRQGFGVRADDYWIEGINDFPNLTAFSVPIHKAGTIYGCLNVVWLEGVLTTEEITGRHGGALQSAADQIANTVAANPKLSAALPYRNRLKRGSQSEPAN